MTVFHGEDTALILSIKDLVKNVSLHMKFENPSGKGWKYIKEDDGTVQQVAHNFEGIGVFSSPSLGKMIPRNVVLGR